MKTFLFSFVTGFVLFSLSFTGNAQDDDIGPCGTRIIRSDFGLLIHGFDGNFVYLFGTGASYEQTMTDRWSMDFGINYHFRIDDRINPPQRYTDVVYFALDFRRYSLQAPSGFYWGPGLALALPTSQTTAGDFFLTGGYQILQDHLAVDLNLSVGYGASRDQIYDEWGTYYETWWGILIRPKVSFGFGF
jgi:hypothetical protein